MRLVFTLTHRWVGLFIAGFLFVSGLTGAVISWDHELDDLLNPHLMEAKSEGPALPVLDLARRVEGGPDPRVQAVAFPMTVEPGESLAIAVLPRADPVDKAALRSGVQSGLPRSSDGRGAGTTQVRTGFSAFARDVRVIPLPVSLQPPHPGVLGHQSVGHLADGWHCDPLDDRLLHWLLSHDAAPSRRQSESASQMSSAYCAVAGGRAGSPLG